MRVNLFNKMNSHFTNKNIDFKVIFLSVSDKNRHWKNNFKNIKFKYEVLENIPIRVGKKDLFTFFINIGIFKVLKRERPNIIIACEWANMSTYLANYYARKNKIKFYLWSGSTKYEKSWRRSLFNPLVKYLIKKTINFIAYGTRAKKYLISLGANPKNVQIIYNSVDIDYFEEKSRKFSEKGKEALKEELGIKTSKTILFSGQLIERKGIFELLEGFKNYQKIDKDASLLIIGKGQEKEKIKEIIESQNIKNIIFTDFIQYDDLYKYYAISDLLILPSREEVWGLVINEAMACGLPIITTHETGASVDLVEENKNGYIIKSNNSKAITEAIQKVFQNNLHKRNNSWQIVQKARAEDGFKKIKL